MRSAIYFGPEDIRCGTVDDVVLRKPHEILVRVLATSICGSDLHLYRGALDPIMTKGKSPTGHELVGEVVEAGREAAASFRPGDVVSMAYSVSCGECALCRVGQTAHCQTTNKAVYGFGVPFGDLNGTHAEALVLPHAATHVMKIPRDLGPAGAVLSCNLPSAVIANRVAAIEPGESVALVGCGPTGLMILDVALQRQPNEVFAIDPVAYRRDAAATRGATPIDSSQEGWKAELAAKTRAGGVDKVFEVVGLPEALQTAIDIVRPGGTIAAMGVFCDDRFNLNLADVFLRNVRLEMNGFACVQPAMKEALRLIDAGVVDPNAYFTHDFALQDIDKAFAHFFTKADETLKVRIRP